MSSLSAPSSAIGPLFFRLTHDTDALFLTRGVLFSLPLPAPIVTGGWLVLFLLCFRVYLFLYGRPVASAPSSLATQTSINFAGSGPAVFQFRVSPVNAKHGPRYDEMVAGEDPAASMFIEERARARASRGTQSRLTRKINYICTTVLRFHRLCPVKARFPINGRGERLRQRRTQPRENIRTFDNVEIIKHFEISLAP